jgi:hypothetical protein
LRAIFEQIYPSRHCAFMLEAFLAVYSGGIPAAATAEQPEPAAPAEIAEFHEEEPSAECCEVASPRAWKKRPGRRTPHPATAATGRISLRRGYSRALLRA